METKDYIYSIGIFTSIVFSGYNLFIALKNRRNSMREHLYKEQIALIQRIFLKINEINIEFDLILNIRSRIYDNEYSKNVKDLGDIIFSNQFILPEILLPKFAKLIKESEAFYSISLSTSDWEKRKEAYEDYYNKYYSLVQFSKEYYGIDNLSNENNKLHKEDSIANAKIIRDVIGKALETAIIR